MMRRMFASGTHCQSGHQLHSLARLFQIIVGLQAHPELLRSAEMPRQPDCGVRRDATLAEDDLVDAARRHADRASKGVLAEIHRLEELLEQHFAGMNVTQALHDDSPAACGMGSALSGGLKHFNLPLELPPKLILSN